MENFEITRKIEEIRKSLNELESLIKNSSNKNVKTVDCRIKNNNKEKENSSTPKYYKIKSVNSKEVNTNQNQNKKEEIIKELINYLFGFENVNTNKEDNKKPKTNNYKYFTPMQTEFPYFDGGKLYRLNHEYAEEFFKKFKINEITSGTEYKYLEMYPKNIYLVHSLGSDYDGKFYITCGNHIDMLISPTEITNSKIRELIQFNGDFLEEVVTILELYKD